MSSMIALAQIEALYYPVGYEETETSKTMYDPDEYWNHEYIPKNIEDSISWRIADCVDDYYPGSFMEIIDGDWGEDGELIYNEVIKRVKVHPDLEIIEGRIIEKRTQKYRLPETSKYPLLVRFPVVLRATFDYDSYTGEQDCSYWIEGIPDLEHLEDLIPKENA